MTSSATVAGSHVTVLYSVPFRSFRVMGGDGAGAGAGAGTAAGCCGSASNGLGSRTPRPTSPSSAHIIS